MSKNVFFLILHKSDFLQQVKQSNKFIKIQELISIKCYFNSFRKIFATKFRQFKLPYDFGESVKKKLKLFNKQLFYFRKKDKNECPKIVSTIFINCKIHNRFFAKVLSFANQ